jgi:hypothetical protein
VKRYAVYVLFDRLQRVRALWQIYRMHWLKRMCPPNAANYLALLEHEMAVLIADFNLEPLQRSVDLEFDINIGITPADKMDAVIGVSLSSFFLLAGLVLLVFALKERSELALLAVVCVCVIVWYFGIRLILLVGMILFLLRSRSCRRCQKISSHSCFDLA